MPHNTAPQGPAAASDPARASARARARRRRLRRLAATLTVTAVLLLSGGYLAAAGLAPLPALKATPSVDRTAQVGASAKHLQAELDAIAEPTAVGWAGSDRVFTNDGSTPHPIASITKLVTVLVCLEQRPLAPGAAGETYTWTAADQQIQARLQAMLAVVFPTKAGTRISESDMLKLILLPSANDYATVYANWVFGDNEHFVAAAAKWARDHGLKSLTVVEPSGIEAGNRASAADLVRLGRIALENPTLLEYTGMRSAVIPGIGKVVNGNPMLSRATGVIGFKTGTTDVAGMNLLLGQKAAAAGRQVTNLAALLGRPSYEARIAAGTQILDVMAGAPRSVRVVTENETVGSVTTWQGERVELRAAGSSKTVLLPGESATRTVEFGEIGAEAAGNRAGEIRIDSPSPADPVPIVTTAAITEPGFWWRVTHPSAVFGWGG